MAKNDGKDAEQAWLKAKQRKGALVERIRDAKDLRGLNNGANLTDFKKPSDFLLAENNVLTFAEVKSVQSGTSFAFSNIKQKQKTTALSLAAKGMGFLYVFYIFSYGRGQWFTMDGSKFAQINSEGRASAKFEELTCIQI